MAEFIDYYEGVEKFSEASMGLEGWKAKFNEQVSIQNSLVGHCLEDIGLAFFY